MQTVVVGGHSRNIGKTSVMAGLMRGLSSFGWTAVKITQHRHELSSPQDEPSASAPAEHDFDLTEERTGDGRGDTSRYLAAGAKRSLWLRVERGSLQKAFPALVRALGRDPFVMIESNSILGFLKPDVYVVVLDSRARDFKPSARKFLERADVLVPVGSLDARAWPGLDPRGFRAKPVFTISPRDYFNPELCRFIRQRLHLSGAASSQNEPRLSCRKEQNWQH